MYLRPEMRLKPGCLLSSCCRAIVGRRLNAGEGGPWKREVNFNIAGVVPDGNGIEIFFTDVWYIAEG